MGGDFFQITQVLVERINAHYVDIHLPSGVETYSFEAKLILIIAKLHDEIVAGSTSLLQRCRHTLPIFLAYPPKTTRRSGAQLVHTDARFLMKKTHDTVQMARKRQQMRAPLEELYELIAVASLGHGNVHTQHHQRVFGYILQIIAHKGQLLLGQLSGIATLSLPINIVENRS